MRIERTPIALIAGLALALGCAVARAPEAPSPEVFAKGIHLDSAGSDPCPVHRQRSTFCRMFRPFSA